MGAPDLVYADLRRYARQVTAGVISREEWYRRVIQRLRRRWPDVADSPARLDFDMRTLGREPRRSTPTSTPPRTTDPPATPRRAGAAGNGGR